MLLEEVEMYVGVRQIGKWGIMEGIRILRIREGPEEINGWEMDSNEICKNKSKNRIKVKIHIYTTIHKIDNQQGPTI